VRPRRSENLGGSPPVVLPRWVRPLGLGLRFGRSRGSARLREPEPDTIRRARAGDLRAFEPRLRDYQADVWRFAYHLTRNRALAEDVTQEAFLRAYRALGSYRGQAKFTSWLLRIVRNCAIDAYRKTRRETPVAEHSETVEE